MKHIWLAKGDRIGPKQIQLQTHKGGALHIKIYTIVSVLQLNCTPSVLCYLKRGCQSQFKNKWVVALYNCLGNMLNSSAPDCTIIAQFSQDHLLSSGKKCVCRWPLMHQPHRETTKSCLLICTSGARPESPLTSSTNRLEMRSPQFTHLHKLFL